MHTHTVLRLNVVNFQVAAHADARDFIFEEIWARSRVRTFEVRAQRLNGLVALREFVLQRGVLVLHGDQRALELRELDGRDLRPPLELGGQLRLLAQLRDLELVLVRQLRHAVTFTNSHFITSLQSTVLYCEPAECSRRNRSRERVRREENRTS